MSGCPSFEELVDWVEGIVTTLPAGHDPAGCTRCARLLEDYRAMAGALKDLPAHCAWPGESPEPPAAATGGFTAALAALPGAVSRAHELLREARTLYGKDWPRVHALGEEALELLALEPADKFARSFALAARADAWEILGNAAARLNRIEEGIQWLELARDFWAQRGEPHAHAATHTNLAIARMLQRDLAGAQADAGRALELYQQIDQIPEALNTMQVLAIVLMDLGRDSEARTLNRRVVTLLQVTGRPVERAMALRTQAELELKDGRRQEAAACLREAIPVLERHDRLHDTARCEAFLGLVESAEPATTEAGLARIRAVREKFAAAGLWLDALSAGIKELEALVGLRRIAVARQLLARLAELVPVDRQNGWVREWMTEYGARLADETIAADEHLAQLRTFETRLLQTPAPAPLSRDMN